MTEEYCSLLEKAKKLYTEEKYDEAQELAFTLVRHEDSDFAPFIIVASVAIRLVLVYTAFGDTANADIAANSLYRMLSLGLRRTASTKEALEGERTLLGEIARQRVLVSEKFLVSLKDLQDKMGFISDKGIHTMNVRAAGLTLGISDAIRESEDFLGLCEHEGKTVEQACEGYNTTPEPVDEEINALIVRYTREMLLDTLDYLERVDENPEPHTGARLISDYYAYDFLISCTMPSEGEEIPFEDYVERLRLSATNLRAMLVSCIICDGNPIQIISENREEIAERLIAVYSKIRSLDPSTELPPLPSDTEKVGETGTEESPKRKRGLLSRIFGGIFKRNDNQ